MRAYRYCPVCAGLLAYTEHDGQHVPICQNPSCGFIFWQHSKPCASVVILNSVGHILLGVRGVDPEKGKLDLPGGFLHEGEHPEDGAKREIREELGVDIEIKHVLGFAIDRYGKEGEHTLNIAMVANIVHGEPRAADDVQDSVWVDPSDVEEGDLAFDNNRQFIHMWLSR